MYQRLTTKSLFLALFFLFNLTVITAEAKDQRTGEEKIRIKAPPSIPVLTEVTFKNITGDSLYFEIKGESQSIHLTDIRKVEIPAGKKKNTAHGMIAGSFIGSLGLGFAAILSVSNEDGMFTPEPGPAFLFGGFLGSVLGLGLGAIIGNGVYTVECEEISINDLLDRQNLALTSNAYSILDTKEINHWHLSFITGSNSGGPKNDIEQAMTYGGFNDISPGGWFSDPSTTPESRTGFGETGIPWILALNYQINQRWKGSIQTG